MWKQRNDLEKEKDDKVRNGKRGSERERERERERVKKLLSFIWEYC